MLSRIAFPSHKPVVPWLDGAVVLLISVISLTGRSRRGGAPDSSVVPLILDQWCPWIYDTLWQGCRFTEIIGRGAWLKGFTGSLPIPKLTFCSDFGGSAQIRGSDSF